MSHKESLETLKQIAKGERSLTSLIGRVYECSFNNYSLAGIISTVKVMPNGVILFNPTADGRSQLSYGLSKNVRYELTPDVTSDDFTLN